MKENPEPLRARDAVIAALFPLVGWLLGVFWLFNPRTRRRGGLVILIGLVSYIVAMALLSMVAPEIFELYAP